MKLNFILNLRMNFTPEDQCMKIYKCATGSNFLRNYFITYQRYTDSDFA